MANQKNNPDFTIITAVYNVEEILLRRCIESCLSQSYKSLEYLLIDDGSTDNSFSICDEYASKDNRIKLFHNDNIGQYNEMNFGINMSKGNYICFLDCDDFIENNYLYDIANNINDKPDIVACRFSVFDGNNKKESTKNNYYGPICKEEAFRLLIEDRVIQSAPWPKAYKRELLLNNPYPTNTFYGDIENTHRLFFAANNFVLVDNSSYVHYVRKGSVSRTDSIERKTQEITGWLKRLEFVSKNASQYVGFVEYQVIKKKLSLLSNNNYSTDDVIRNKHILKSVKNDLITNKKNNMDNEYLSSFERFKYKLVTNFSYNRIINHLIRIIKICNKKFKIVK